MRAKVIGSTGRTGVKRLMLGSIALLLIIGSSWLLWMALRLQRIRLIELLLGRPSRLQHILSKMPGRFDELKVLGGGDLKKKLTISAHRFSASALAKIEQAGGKASDGFNRIMELQPTELHQRVPFFCGSYNMVEKAEEFMGKQNKS